MWNHRDTKTRIVFLCVFVPLWLYDIGPQEAESGKEYKVFMGSGPTLQSNEVPMIEAFLTTTKRLQTLVKADVWLHSHLWSVSFFQKYERFKARKPDDPNPYVNPGEIPVFLQQRLEDTEKRLAEAKAKAASSK